DRPLFEEEENHDKSTSNQEEEDEGPSDPIQTKIIPETRKRPNWLKATLEYDEGHGAAKGTFRERKIPKKYSRYSA
ncbi:hypothetical protein, partial [Actinobacillus pleuropneumoniae]|uniref:hypothetical protein n=1 Tax=Actinobacillus pleuropneumoniae TaxID=715 RepID=UPI00227A48D6